MAIDGVGPSNNTGAVGGADAARTEAANRVRPHDQADTSPTQSSGTQGGDRVELSSEAQQAAQAYGASPVNLEDIRTDKVEEAKKFLKAGLYNDKGVIEQTAQSIYETQA